MIADFLKKKSLLKGEVFMETESCMGCFLKIAKNCFLCKKSGGNESEKKITLASIGKRARLRKICNSCEGGKGLVHLEVIKIGDRYFDSLLGAK